MNGPEPSNTSQPRTRIDWDVRGILAVMGLIGAFGLAIGQLIQGQSAEIPSWAAATVSAIIGFYFGSRSQDSGR